MPCSTVSVEGTAKKWGIRPSTRSVFALENDLVVFKHTLHVELRGNCEVGVSLYCCTPLLVEDAIELLARR